MTSQITSLGSSLMVGLLGKPRYADWGWRELAFPEHSPKELSQGGLLPLLIMCIHGRKNVSFKAFSLATPALCFILFFPILHHYLVFWIFYLKSFKDNITIFKYLWRCKSSHFPSIIFSYET